VIGNAVMIAKSATGEIDHHRGRQECRSGRAGRMTAKKRPEIARKAAKKRWKTTSQK